MMIYVYTIQMNQNTKEKNQKTKQYLQSYKDLDIKPVFKIFTKPLQRTERKTIFAYKVITNAYGYTKNLKGNLLF